jgi:hypothetical protein
VEKVAAAMPTAKHRKWGILLFLSCVWLPSPCSTGYVRVQNGDLVRFTAQEELRRLKIVLLTHEVVEDVSRLLKWFWTISPMLLHDTTP